MCILTLFVIRESEWIKLSSSSFKLNENAAKLFRLLLLFAILCYHTFRYFEFFQLLCCDISPGNFMEEVELPSFTMFLWLQVCRHKCSSSRDIPGDSWPSTPNMRQYLQDLQKTEVYNKTFHSYLASHIRVCIFHNHTASHHHFIILSIQESLYILSTICDPPLINSILVMSDNGDKGKDKEKDKDRKDSGSGRTRVRLSLHLPSYFPKTATITSDVFDALQVFLEGGPSFREMSPHLHTLTGLWSTDPTARIPVIQLCVCSYLFIHSSIFSYFTRSISCYPFSLFNSHHIFFLSHSFFS